MYLLMMYLHIMELPAFHLVVKVLVVWEECTAKKALGLYLEPKVLLRINLIKSMIPGGIQGQNLLKASLEK